MLRCESSVLECGGRSAGWPAVDLLAGQRPQPGASQCGFRARGASLRARARAPCGARWNDFSPIIRVTEGLITRATTWNHI